MKKSIILIALLATNLSKAEIKEDKKLHFAAGAISGTLGYSLVYDATESKSKALLASIGTAALIGFAKELSDSNTDGNKFDNNDLAATTLGGFSVGIVINLLNNKKNSQKIITLHRKRSNRVRINIKKHQKDKIDKIFIGYLNKIIPKNKSPFLKKKFLTLGKKNYFESYK